MDDNATMLLRRTDDAEQAVLCAVLIAPSVLGTVKASGLTPDDFARSTHRRIYGAMLDVDARGQLVDPITLAERLEERGEMDAVGGRDAIGQLLDVMPTAANVLAHVAIVLDHAKRRALVVAFEQAAGLARAGQETPSALAAKVRTALQKFERANDTGERRFAPIDDLAISTLPRMSWLIDGLLPAGALAEVAAPPKCLKSFLALDWAFHIATGMNWCGRPVRRGPVVYVYAEGRHGLQARVDAWKRFANLEGERLGVYFVPRRVNMDQPAEAAELLAEVQRLDGASPALIIVDTLARCMTGDENTTVDMGRFVAGCDLLREATGATVAVVHHMGLSDSDRGRGSSALEAACDTVILCERDSDALELTIKSKWQKDAAPFAPINMEAVPILQSLVLLPSGVHDAKLTGQKLACLRALHRHFDESGAANKDWHSAAGIKAESSFNKALGSLITAGYVRKHGAKWHVTDSGHLALGSTGSTATPLGESGARSTNSTREGGSIGPPRVESDPVLPFGDDTTGRAA